MLLPIDRLINTPILSLQTGIEIAKLGEPIVDPRQLKIAAFRVSSSRSPGSEVVLHPDDIREISNIGIIVDSQDSLMETEDLVRLQEVIDFGFSLINLRAEEENGHKIGRVKGYAIDPSSFFIQQIYIKPPVMKSLSVTELSIHRNQVKSINNDRLIVKSATVKEEVKLEGPSPAFVNPFRATTSAQPEG